jgi:hypothetical protein
MQTEEVLLDSAITMLSLKVKVTGWNFYIAVDLWIFV